MKALVFVLSIISFPLLSTVIPKQPHIYVEGHAEQEVIPDQIKISVSVMATHMDAEIAKIEIDEKSLKLFEATKVLGIKQEQITATPIQIYPAIEHQNGKSVNVGTRVSRNIDILLQDLTKYPALNDALVEAEITSKISSTVELSDERAIKRGINVGG
ncbi:SIMPL domain-containing protein [Psychrosphaera aquimarina]|uniref:SIMPL domain-containing protein n=1 Tax=Psychrosphaera aquimarina TaxID=2044854 RepID=A0ABU3R169_9GAMM|nr:SIMPL domain-containing protein [Psychrosphaera aquimarina]MDU0113417.1 SIMPL domain-containing protein [Psychrosphaera aquimarina]